MELLLLLMLNFPTVNQFVITLNLVVVQMKRLSKNLNLMIVSPVKLPNSVVAWILKLSV